MLLMNYGLKLKLLYFIINELDFKMRSSSRVLKPIKHSNKPQNHKQIVGNHSKTVIVVHTRAARKIRA